MYSQKITAEQVRKVSKQLGFQLEYHSTQKIDEQIKRLNEIMGDDGRLVRALRDDEKKFIINERWLSKLDFRYFLTRYCFILHFEGGQIIRFNPNIAQSLVLDVWAELEEQKVAIMIQQLKARQLGVTTLTEMAVQHRTQFYKHTNSLIASSDPDKSRKMAGMIDRCYENEPWWLRPELTSYRAGELMEYGGLDSGISIQHGAQFTGLGRGSTPNVAHLCVSPHTLIHTGNGFLRPMSEVLEGDSVITHTGKSAKVLRKIVSQRKDEMTSDIWLWGCFAPLSTTRDHEILTSDGWKEARNIKKGDWLRHPVREIKNTLSQFCIEHRTSGRPRHLKTKEQSLPLNRAMGHFCGLFLAEGSIQFNASCRKGTDRASIIITCDKDETDSFSERIKNALGENQHIGVRRRNSRTVQLAIHVAALSRWMCSQFGHKDEKRVPDWSWEAGRDFCLGILEGYLEGDGHHVPDSNEIYASSVRVQLPVQMRDLAASLGFGWSAIQFKSSGIYYKRNCREQWTLIICGETGARLRESTGYRSKPFPGESHWRWSEDQRYVEIEVQTVADGFSSSFYDLEVAHTDHTFTTLQCAVKNSEVAEYIDPEELIDASLLNAMHPSARMFLILESTAKGRKNYWHRMWMDSKAKYERGTSSFYPMFLPWFVGKDIWPTEGWIRKHPIPAEYEPATLTYHHSERAKNYVRSNDLLRKFLGENWEMPVEQMWWWELTRDEYKSKDMLNKFYEEMPADDLEAFQSTNRSAFDADTLSVYREGCKPPLGVFGFRGRPDEIPLRMQPESRDIDFNLPNINIKSRWNPSQSTSECQLVPLKIREWPLHDPMGKLLIWEMPEDEEEYGVGIDTGDGVGLDRTTIEVIRKATMERSFGQAAEFHSPYIGASEFWPLSLAVSTLYSTYRKGQVRQARVCIDCLRNGESIQFEMKKLGYWNFHPWLRYDHKRVRTKDATRQGFFSNSWARAMMMDYIIRALKDGFIDIYSPYFVDEMGELERDEGRQSLKAVYGGHDDLFVAMGQIYFSLIILDVRAGRPIAMPPSSRNKVIAYKDPIWTPGYQATDAGPREWGTRDELLERVASEEDE